MYQRLFFFLEFFDDHYIYQLYINIVDERFGKLIKRSFLYVLEDNATTIML